MRRFVWLLSLAAGVAVAVAACAGMGGYGGGAPTTYEVWIPDQGYDKVIIYTVNEGDGEVKIAKSGEIALAPPSAQPTVAPHILLFGPGYLRAYVAGVRAGGMFGGKGTERGRSAVITDMA